MLTTVSEITLTGMKKHVSGLEAEAAWIERYRHLWDARFDALDKVVEELKRTEKPDEPQR